MNISKYKRRLIAVMIAILAVLTLVAVTLVLKRAEGDAVPEEEPAADILKSAERLNFLLLGCDRTSGLTDVMMLVSVDTDGRSMDILQIPRDTYARYTGRGYKKLNGAMAVLGGADKLCELLSESMGVDIDGYFLFTPDAFVNVVDALGGVEIDLPFDMDYNDPYQGLSIHLDAGRQTLDGEAAEKFVRYRAGYVRGDIGRMDAQKIFMSAFVGKVTENLTPTAALRILRALSGEIQTNLSLGEMTELALTALKISAENITMMTLSGEDVRPSPGGAWYYVLSASAAKSALREYAGAEGDFDRDGIFYDPKNPQMERIYRSDMPNMPSRASEIIENGIEIQKR